MGTVLVEYPSCRDENNHNTREKDVAHDIHRMTPANLDKNRYQGFPSFLIHTTGVIV